MRRAPSLAAFARVGLGDSPVSVERTLVSFPHIIESLLSLYNETLPSAAAGISHRKFYFGARSIVGNFSNVRNQTTNFGD
jgi:hypothetical protein